MFFESLEYLGGKWKVFWFYNLLELDMGKVFSIVVVFSLVFFLFLWVSSF